MFNINKIFTNQDDFQKFYVEEPDPDFSPERNKAVIAETIREYEEIRRLKKKEFDENLEERVEATASLIDRVRRVGDIEADKYFGKRELARLRGEKIIEDLKIAKAKHDVFR